MGNILIVDDEKNYLFVLEELLTDEGYQVYTADSARRGLEIVQEQDLDAVMTDMKMPGMDGNETLKAIKAMYPLVEVIMLTGHATVDSAIDGLRNGAFDYLMKPADLDQILEKSLDAFEKRQRIEEKIRVAQMKIL